MANLKEKRGKLRKKSPRLDGRSKKNEDVKTLMNEEDKRKRATERLTSEERTQRLRYGGEGMRAELAMEENEMRRRGQNVGRQGASFEQGLTPEEQERRSRMERGTTYPGYGEEQQAQMAMWGSDYRMAQQIREDWRSRQTQQGEMPEQQLTEERRRPYPTASTEEELTLRRETLRETAPAQDESYRREPSVVAPVGGEYGMQERAPEMRRRGQYEMTPAEEAAQRRMGAPYQEEMSREEMMRSGSEQVQYRPGSGSYYSETFEKPTGRAAPESYFGEGAGGMEERRGAARRGVPVSQPGGTGSLTTGRSMPTTPSPAHRGVSREEMMSEGEKEYWYRPGSGSYYSETWERPTGGAAPGAYTRSVQPQAQQPMPQRQPSRQMQMPRSMEEVSSTAKQMGGQVSQRAQEVGGTIMEKTKQATQQLGARAQNISQPGRAEEMARSSGEVIGKGLRKLANVVTEWTSGFNRGVRSSAPPPQQRRMEQQPPMTQTEEMQRRQATMRRPMSQEEEYLQETGRYAEMEQPQEFVTEETKKKEVRKY